ncbi:flagellin biosynthesis protein FlgD [Thalassococcus profundi]|uniref:Basal-body rod modification protein FlgD n=1 Tax=Thalassococcus profundi TaxID=2282382 RepID=A0A369TSG3_9RHOB|nr:flagellar hook capping FlgD N-terminal domain-containing protein [Thalassococcus profundi]RDD68193.1 flagellin biosynthesis protein FlgD [Thalassococcus profundi]
MDITQAPPPAFGAETTVAAGKQADPLSSDFETFLRMLTVQMQNQDPLNPVDSADYAVQLATFSSVEQQVTTNDLLRALTEQIGGGSVQQLAGWIGMDALVRAPVAFDGTPVELRPEFAPTSDAGVLVVRDASGAVVRKDTLTPDADAVSWAGVDANGSPLPTGAYRFELESYRNGTLIDTKLAPAYSRISEARIDDGSILLRLSDGSEIVSTLVTGLRAPD